MAMIDTMPQLRVARINGITGLGYAEVISQVSENLCRGVVIFDDETDLSQLRTRHSEDDVVFEGILFYNGEEIAETLTVEILYTSFDEADPGLTFKGKIAPKIF